MRITPDYPGLAMVLAFAQLLEPAEVTQLLERRSVEAESQLSGMNAGVDAALKQRAKGFQLNRANLLEAEYMIALKRAEVDWLQAIVADLREGRLTWDPAAQGRWEGKPEGDTDGE